MRGKLSAGVLIALAFLVPAAPAVAQDAPPVLNSACQPAERKVFKDIRELITIDLDTATDTAVRVLADQILSEAKAESLPVLPPALQKQLDGTPDDLRKFLKTDVTKAWTVDLRISVGRTLTGAGPHVKAAAQKVLDDVAIDTYLTYLNDGLYVARALDCASQPSPSPSTSTQPTPSPSASTPSATPSSTSPAATVSTSPAAPGTGGGLPVTGSATGAVAGIGGALLILGFAGYLIGRRRRSRFVA